VGSWTILEPEVTDKFYTYASPTSGTSYAFRVDARNSVGWSAYSNEVDILAAQAPDQPAAPSTYVDGDNVIITWLAPNNRGSPITSYTIKFVQYDGVSYAEELTSCDGTDPVVVQNLDCAVPISALKTNPFSLPWGTSVYAKVSATSIYGTSAISAAGNGAIILTVPDAPINLQNVVAITNANQIGLSWDKASEEGGTAVLDYIVIYDQGSSNFVPLASSLTGTTYTAVGLEAGVTYTFQIVARNAFGESNPSTSASILAAQVPDKPNAPTTEVIGMDVQVSWDAPFNQGSLITSYKVYIETSTVGVYTLDLTNCDGSDAAIMSTTSCLVPISELRGGTFTLSWGTHVNAKVIATNAYGDSLESAVGNGAKIITYPDAPVSLTEVTSSRTATEIGL
jgi:hypothetical protein